jgi:hypothetical protein
MSKRLLWLCLIFGVAPWVTEAVDAPAGKPLFSLDPGSRWKYEELQTSQQIAGSKTNLTRVSGTVDEEVLRAPPEYSDKGHVVLYRSAAKEQRDNNGEVTPVSGGFVQLLGWQNDDLYIHGLRVWVDGSYSEDMNIYDPPLLYLKGEARVGDSWTVGTQKIMGVRMPTMATFDGVEAVTVPAGVFSNCLKITYVTWKMSGISDSGTSKLLVQDGNVRDTVWYAKDVGIVKEVQIKTTIYATGQGSVVSHDEQTKLLKSYTPVK